MSEKQEQPKTFWLQQGSFRTIVVDNDKANPDWGRKPFKVIEIFALEEPHAKLLSAQKKIEAQGLEIKMLREQRNDYIEELTMSYESVIEKLDAEISDILNTQEGLMHIGVDPSIPSGEVRVIQDGKCVLKIINIGKDSK